MSGKRAKESSSDSSPSPSSQDGKGLRVGFVGAGNMASAMFTGFIASGMLDPSLLTASDPNPPSVEKVTRLGGQSAASPGEVAQRSDVVFLATKPDKIAYVAKQIGEAYAGKENEIPLIVSIAAGVSLSTIEEAFPQGNVARVVRVMPNTPCLVSQSASGYIGGTNASPEDVDLVGKLMNSVGVAVQLAKEEHMDAVIGVAGSAPAYVFIFIEALADGGVRAGLPRDTALQLATQTVKGAATMVQQTGTHPGILKDQVCSPGGTTIAAVESLEKNNFRATAMGAVSAAVAQAQEMSRPKGDNANASSNANANADKKGDASKM